MEVGDVCWMFVECFWDVVEYVGGLSLRYEKIAAAGGGFEI